MIQNKCKTTLVLGRKGAKVLRLKISEMITDRYKLRIPPTVYYDLLADVRELEEEQRPKFIAKSDGTIEQIKNCNDCLFKKEWEKIGKLLSVVLEKQTEQEPKTFKWCTDCKEYDQEKHCCHRWSKVIRNTVEEMKQEYIEREVLDKIRAEIEKEIIPRNSDQYDHEAMWQNCGLRMALKVIDKYQKETEEE